MNSQLNLANIDELLQLPCVIDINHPLRYESILTSSKDVIGMTIIKKVNTGETLNDFLWRIYNGANRYRMDPSIYCQLAALVLSGKWPYNGGQIVLFVDETVWNRKIPQMGYIGIYDRDVNNILDFLPTEHKGSWVIRIDTDKFLTLNNNGPVILSMNEIILKLRNGLYEYCRSRDHDKCSTISKKMKLELYFEIGKMDRLGFFNKQGIPSITQIWNNHQIAHSGYDGMYIHRSLMDKYEIYPQFRPILFTPKISTRLSSFKIMNLPKQIKPSMEQFIGLIIRMNKMKLKKQKHQTKRITNM